MLSKNTVQKKIYQLGCLILVFVLPILNFNTASAEDGASIDEEIATSNLHWGGSKLPYNKLADIKDGLTTEILGKGVLDRHGIGSGMLSKIGGVFNSPQYGELVFISLWESKTKGCFVEMIVQHSPKSNQTNLGTANSMIPTLLEVGIGKEKIALLPKEKSSISFPPQSYSYNESTGNGYTITQTGIWYMARNLFVLDANSASILSNAPIKEVKARLTFEDGQTINIPIGEGTVKKWKDVYSFNPKCTNLETSKK